MSRLFNGTGDEMVYPSPDFLFGTLLKIVKLNSAAAWFSLIEFETAGGALQGAFLRHNGGSLAFNNGSTNLTGVAFSSADGWAVIATAKATGTVAANNYKIPVGGATTTAATGAGANMFSSAGGVMRIGGNDDFAAMYLAAVGVFNGVVLSQAEIEGIATALTTQSIADLSPTALYDDSDAFATNLVNPGTFDRSDITGTTDSADDPSGYVYGLGGGGLQVDPAFISAGSQVFSPTISVGPVTISPALLDNAETIYAPTLTPGPVTITPAFLDTAAQLYAPSTGGEVSVTPDMIPAESQVFAPTVTSTISVAPDLLANSSTVFAPTLTPGPVTITPGFLGPSSQVFSVSSEGGDDTTPDRYSPQVPSIPVIRK